MIVHSLNIQAYLKEENLQEVMGVPHQKKVEVHSMLGDPIFLRN
jgi:hypothetical protein